MLCSIDPFLAQASSEDGLGMVLRGGLSTTPASTGVACAHGSLADAIATRHVMEWCEECELGELLG